VSAAYLQRGEHLDNLLHVTRDSLTILIVRLLSLNQEVPISELSFAGALGRLPRSSQSVLLSRTKTKCITYATEADYSPNLPSLLIAPLEASTTPSLHYHRTTQTQTPTDHVSTLTREHVHLHCDSHHPSRSLFSSTHTPAYPALLKRSLRT
jgi:hypothetical protein